MLRQVIKKLFFSFTIFFHFVGNVANDHDTGIDYRTKNNNLIKFFSKKNPYKSKGKLSESEQKEKPGEEFH